MATTLEREPSVAALKTSTIDADVHNMCMPEALAEMLPERWRRYLATFGTRSMGEVQLIRARRMASRVDAWPPNGKLPGQDPDFVREHHLDAWGLRYAILDHMLGTHQPCIGGHQPAEFTIALMSALNDLNERDWFSSDPRWLASICVPLENGAAAADEIARRAESAFGARFVQVLLPDRTEKPIGNEKYWPLWEAAAAFGKPVGFHPGGMGMNQVTACGWPSYYFEDHAGYPQAIFNQLASLIFEGVFDRWPDLRIVVIEGGYSWAAPYGWRLDNTWSVLKEEVPHLQRKPSEYLRDHLYFTTQPVEEPEDPKWAAGIFEQMIAVGLGERLMFSSDYPHWDFDAPTRALPASLPSEWRDGVLHKNAERLYDLPRAA